MIVTIRNPDRTLTTYYGVSDFQGRPEQSVGEMYFSGPQPPKGLGPLTYEGEVVSAINENLYDVGESIESITAFDLQENRDVVIVQTGYFPSTLEAAEELTQDPDYEASFTVISSSDDVDRFHEEFDTEQPV